MHLNKDLELYNWIILDDGLAIGQVCNQKLCSQLKSGQTNKLLSFANFHSPVFTTNFTNKVTVVLCQIIFTSNIQKAS